MPRVRVPVRRSGVRYSTRPGRRFPIRPTIAPVAPAKKSGLLALLGGLGGLLLCFLCLATAGLLGLFATLVAITAYLADVFQTFDDLTDGSAYLNVNMAVLLVALLFASFHKLFRSS